MKLAREDDRVIPAMVKRRRSQQPPPQPPSNALLTDPAGLFILTDGDATTGGLPIYTDP